MKDEKRTFTCIICPNGCVIETQKKEKRLLSPVIYVSEEKSTLIRN